MNYTKKQLEKFNSEKTPNWKRIKLPGGLFPSDLKPFKDFEVKGNDLYQGICLRHAINGEANLSGISDYNTLNEYLSIDEETKENLGEKFCSYVNAEFNHGLIIHAEKNKELKLYFSYDLNEKSPCLVDHHLIIADEGADIDIIFDYKSKDNSEHNHYSSIKIIAKENSRVKMTQIQRLNDHSNNFQQVFTKLSKNASVVVNDAQIGGKLKAVSILQNIRDTGGEALTNALYYSQRGSKTDISYTNRHKGARSESSIFCKGAMNKDSKKVFRGNLYFERGASQSVGKEEEFVLLLDPNLKSDSIPGLFCLEDNVIGEHAASVGQVDQNKMFYMMSRGFDEETAKRLMIESGYQEVIQRMNIGHLGEEIISELNERIN